MNVQLLVDQSSRIVRVHGCTGVLVTVYDVAMRTVVGDAYGIVADILNLSLQSELAFKTISNTDLPCIGTSWCVLVGLCFDQSCRCVCQTTTIWP